jgi:hypothetical protein
MRKAKKDAAVPPPAPATLQPQLELSPPNPPPPANAMESFAIKFLVADAKAPSTPTRRAPIASGLMLKHAPGR